MLHELSACSEQQIEKAEAIAEKLILKGASNAGNQIEIQLDAAAQSWEERLRKAGTEGEANIRRASRLAWTGAILLFIFACVMIGSSLGNLVFSLIHHDEQSNSFNDTPQLLRVAGRRKIFECLIKRLSLLARSHPR